MYECIYVNNIVCISIMNMTYFKYIIYYIYLRLLINYIYKL